MLSTFFYVESPYEHTEGPNAAIPKKNNDKLIDRPQASDLLTNISGKKESAIIVTYGRRRVGKTELLKQTFQNRHILKFERLEGLHQANQITSVLWQLSEYAGNPLIAKLKLDTWKEVFWE